MICEFCCECKKWTNFEMLVSQDGTQYSPLSANEMYSPITIWGFIHNSTCWPIISTVQNIIVLVFSFN